MSDLNAYLAQRFLNAQQFAVACRISTGELSTLIQGRFIPAPSYIVSQSSTITSYVFGEMQAPGAIDGQYFHPANAAWVKIARSTIADVGRQRAYEALKKRCDANFQSALTDLNATTWRLRDSFADDGSAIVAGLRARLDSLWEHFLAGTFGLCVANPISEAAIARKEILQEKLAALSDDGKKTSFAADEARNLLLLIDAYAQSAMPFSPIEYSISSRKRLVEDLLVRIGGL